MLSQSEFQILVQHVRHPDGITQRDLAAETGLSLGETNVVVRELSTKGLVNENGITAEGVVSLKPYKVDNAIIMAAGMSSRFVPLSFEKPKGLLNVKGEILIEREIRQLQEAGITDITVVVGYMKETFFYLEQQFGVKIVVNEDYYKYNNTSTLICVLDRLSNTYICSSDNYFVDNVFEPYVYRAYYAAVYTPGETNEYCLTCNQDGRITNVTIGGKNAWYMLGHVYFDRAFSEKFKQILIREYSNQETRMHLWEDLYMRYTQELDMYIRKYDANKVKEFDSLDELRTFDEYYINNTDSAILKNICKTLSCNVEDIQNIQNINTCLPSISFMFHVFGNPYVYHHPGKGHEKYLNQKEEAFPKKKASAMELDNTSVYTDPDNGWMIYHYVPESSELD